MLYRRSGFSPIESNSQNSSQPNQGGLGIEVPQAEMVFVPALPATVTQDSESIGQSISNPAMTISWGLPIISAQLTSAQASLVRKGEVSSVVLSAANESHRGVVATNPIALNDSGQGTTDTVTIALDGGLIGTELNHRCVCTIIVESTHSPVLAVPITALIAQSDGATAVAVDTHGRIHKVRVVAGLAIGGYVPITPTNGRLIAGENVVVN
jgi:hypothetical protein